MDMLYNEDEKPVVRTRKTIPPEYLTIKLSSLGKLSAPAILHFRDYSIDDAMKMGLSTDENILETLVGVLNNMVFEKFDCSDLHESELEEIMINIYANFWGKIIKDCPFPFNDEEYELMSEETIEQYKKNFPTVDINLSKLNNNLISEEFKEPITISNDQNIKIQFILPKIKHLFIAKEYCENKYIREEQLFHKITENIKYNERIKDESKHKPIDSEELNQYSEYLKNRADDYVSCKNSLTILNYGNKNFKDMPIEERIKSYREVPFQLWDAIGNIFSKMSFGIDHNVEVISPLDKKPVIRRVSFRPMDLFRVGNYQTIMDILFHLGLRFPDTYNDYLTMPWHLVMRRMKWLNDRDKKDGTGNSLSSLKNKIR